MLGIIVDTRLYKGYWEKKSPNTKMEPEKISRGKIIYIQSINLFGFQVSFPQTTLPKTIQPSSLKNGGKWRLFPFWDGICLGAKYGESQPKKNHFRSLLGHTHLNRESRNKASQGRPKRHSDAISWIFSAPNRVGLATNWNLIREFAIKFLTRKCLDFTKDLRISYKLGYPNPTNSE